MLKEALDNTHNILYQYKKCTSIPPLSLVDDILAVSVCSTLSPLIPLPRCGAEWRVEHEHVYELFKYGGKDLKISLLMET